MSTEATIIEQPKTEHASLTLGGDDFAKSVAARKAAAEAAPVIEPPPPAKVPDKPAEPAKKADEPAKPAVKTTPLDISAPAKKDEPPAPADEEIATLLKSEPPPNASPSSKANHAAMRKGLEHANAKIQKLVADLNEAKTKTTTAPPELQERLKTVEETLKEREALIERIGFERSPRYQKFVSEGNAELTAAKSYLEGADAVKNADGEAIDPGVIELAAQSKGSRRLQILTQSGMDAGTISAVTSHLARADAINRDREAAQENWKATQADWTAEQTKAAEAKTAQTKANEDRVFAEVGKRVSETLAPFQRAEGNDEWNTGVEQRFKEAQEYFDGKKPLADTSQLIYDGLAGRVYKDAFEDLRTKYNELVAETDRIKAARPGAASGKSDSATAVSTGDPMRDAAATFNEMRAKRGL